MRRSQNEVTGHEALLEIINACDVIRIGMSVKDVPYIVPLNFGYKDNVFYIHGAKEGRKIEMIKINPQVCFEMDTEHQLVNDSNRACDWTMTYASIMGTGVMTVVENPDEKKEALNLLMQQYGGNGSYAYEDKMLERIGILKLVVTEMTGKKS